MSAYHKRQLAQLLRRLTLKAGLRLTGLADRLDPQPAPLQEIAVEMTTPVPLGDGQTLMLPVSHPMARYALATRERARNN